MYFELKKVPEMLRLPLVLRAIKEPVNGSVFFL